MPESETVVRVRVSTEDFIRGWESSNSVGEVAQKLGLKPTSAQARACKYRAEGIALKKMKRGGHGPRLNVEGAKAFLESLRTS